MTTPAAGAPRPDVKSLICPNCGGTVELRGYAHTLNVVCVNCLTILDARTPSLAVLQTFQTRQRYTVHIPLGTRGKLHGDVYEVTGFQVRGIEVDGIPYEWSEYVLFNPFKGFRYLTEYDGHWNDVKPVKSIPQRTSHRGKPAVTFLNETYRIFQTSTARTVYVLGEFPWQVRVGEAARVEDYVSPPRILSWERTGQEETWSLGEYMTGEKVWQAFQPPGKPPEVKGVYANQPSPHTQSMRGMWGMCLALLIMLFGISLLCSVLMRQEEVFRQKYSLSALQKGEGSFVTSVFDLKGRESNVEISIRTDLDNSWAYFDFALINEATGVAYDFNREVSYYYGRDSDGSWSEGGRSDSVLIPRIPSGRYYLRVEPDLDRTGPQPRSVNYELAVRRDVPFYLVIWIAAALLLLPPAYATYRHFGFEGRRWMESDYSSKDDDD